MSMDTCHGIELHDGATVIDMSANIGVPFRVRTLQKEASVRVIACEPVPQSLSVEANATTW